MIEDRPQFNLLRPYSSWDVMNNSPEAASY